MRYSSSFRYQKLSFILFFPMQFPFHPNRGQCGAVLPVAVWVEPTAGSGSRCSEGGGRNVGQPWSASQRGRRSLWCGATVADRIPIVLRQLVYEPEAESDRTTTSFSAITQKVAALSFPAPTRADGDADCLKSDENVF